MKIVLATGIYPPDIGGPATYVRALAEELTKRGMCVTVVTYGKNAKCRMQNAELSWDFFCVSRFGGPLLRWLRYARALRTHGADADVVLAFSLVSCGVPLWWAHLKRPKKVLRLGGDFLWERYTDFGGGRGLREFYEGFSFQLLAFRKWLQLLLLQFDHVVFSTQLQKEVYESYYKSLPPHSVIENALEAKSSQLKAHTRHTPFRLLFLGRFVAFKNISALLRAITELPRVTLTLVGEGPLLHLLEGNVQGLKLQDRVTFRPKVRKEGRDLLFHGHDLLVIPSVTEMSPNTALEARVVGLPVLLTEETGLSEQLRQGMVVRKLRTAEQIRDAVREVMANYEHITGEAARSPADRSWGKICEEYLQLFDAMSSPSPLSLSHRERELSMNLLMISGDRSLVAGKRGAFYATLEELRKHWERIDVICPRVAVSDERSAMGTLESTQSPKLKAQSSFDNVFLHPSPRGLWYQPLWILKQGKELSRQHQYNVMTVHDYPPFYNGCGAWLLHRATHIPWVAEIHHVVGYPVAANVREWIGRKMYPLHMRTCGRSATAFRVVNGGTCDLLKKWGVESERIHLVPSFYLDHGLLRPDPTIEKKYDVVFCGRLVANKGPEAVLGAAGLVALRQAQGDTAVSVLIIGDGPLRQNLEPRTYKLKTRVTFAGWLSSLQEVYRAMQSAKIFIMCSKSEGGPRVVLEAMALGLPVIATNVGAVPDVIHDGENGLITSGTPQDLAEKIFRLLSDGKLRNQIGNEAEKVCNRFERKDLIARYADFLKSFA